jgi:hypothetical protein
MAFHSWISTLEDNCYLESAVKAINAIKPAFTIVQSNKEVIYTIEKECSAAQAASRVRVIARWANKASKEMLMEVISEESMLKKGMRCETVATELKEHLPAFQCNASKD